ncbi:MAG TPA: metallophosphoesterase [Candidatus Pacearchaeota archaeon]|nr:metallophosphoesterase [Candidatus Pacearchaeota archaeon]
MIVVGDLHIKNSEPHMKAIGKLFDYLEVNYPNENMMLLGDVFDSTGVPFNVVTYFIERTKKFGKHWYIISGNHDESVLKKNILEPLSHLEHITVFFEKTEIDIDGLDCLMLPYVHKAKEVYADIEWQGSVCFLHVTNIEDQWLDEGVNTDKINALQIFGHTHTHKEYPNKIILGVTLPTRNGEVSNRILFIDEKTKEHKYIDKDFSEFLSYETIEYGNFPVNKNNILNVIKAPSVPSVHSMYKDYYIREEGIELLIDEAQYEGESVFEFDSADNKKSFVEYGKEKGIRNEIVEKGLEYLV